MALSVGLVSMGLASTASADGITFNEGKMLPARADTRSDVSLNWIISKRDCDDDIDLPFDMTLTGVAANQTLEVWASDGSVDCIAQTARVGAAKFCTQLAGFPIPTNSNSVVTWKGKAADIANAHTKIDQCTAPDSTPLDLTLTFLQMDSSDATGMPKGSGVWSKSKLRLRAPDPPLLTGIKTGEAGLSLTFAPLDTTTQSYVQEYLLFCDPPPGGSAAAGCGCTNPGTSTGTTTTTTTTTSVGGSANPPPPGVGGTGGMTGGTGGMTGGTGGMTGGTGGMTGGTGGMTGGTGGMTGGTGGMTGGTGGTTAGGGAGGGGSGGDTGTCTITNHTADSCSSCDLKPGDPAPTKDSAYFCGSASSATSTQVDSSISLENGRGYAAGIAILDKVGNISALSTLECGTPAEVTDFYESYRGRGGTAGGGLCAMRPATRDNGVLAPFGAGFALLVLGGRRLARRRRDRREAQPLPRGNGEAR